MTRDQIIRLASNAGVLELLQSLPEEQWIPLVERLTTELTKESISICQDFINVYTNPENYKDSWYTNSKIDAFKQVRKAFECRYRSEHPIIEIEDIKYN
jgi:hypothetical protein